MMLMPLFKNGAQRKDPMFKHGHIRKQQTQISEKKQKKISKKFHVLPPQSQKRSHFFFINLIYFWNPCGIRNKVAVDKNRLRIVQKAK